MPLCYLQPCHALGRTGPPALHWCSRRMEERGCLADMCRSTLSIHVSDLTPSSLIETVIQLFKLHARTKTVVTSVHHTVLRLRKLVPGETRLCRRPQLVPERSGRPSGATRCQRRDREEVPLQPGGKTVYGLLLELARCCRLTAQESPENFIAEDKSLSGSLLRRRDRKLLVTRKRTVYIQGFRQLEIESILPA